MSAAAERRRMRHCMFGNCHYLYRLWEDERPRRVRSEFSVSASELITVISIYTRAFKSQGVT